jgi:hypothetical protein
MFVGDTLMNREKFFEGNTREEAENKRRAIWTSFRITITSTM